MNQSLKPLLRSLALSGCIAAAVLMASCQTDRKIDDSTITVTPLDTIAQPTDTGMLRNDSGGVRPEVIPTTTTQERQH